MDAAQLSNTTQSFFHDILLHNYILQRNMFFVGKQLMAVLE